MTVDDLSVSHALADLKASLEVYRAAGDVLGCRLDAIEEQMATDETGLVAALIHDAAADGPQTFDRDWWHSLDTASRARVAQAWHDDTLGEGDVVQPRPIKPPEQHCRGGEPKLIGEILPGVIRRIADRDPNAPQWAREIGDD